MTQDLTKITTPFGLLDEQTQEALRAHGGPYEWWQGIWEDIEPMWGKAITYRVKPQPPKPREWWIVKHRNAHGLYVSEVTAKAVADDHGGELIHVREVLE